MGLDNGFLLRRKSAATAEPIEIAYFRKFCELDDWCFFHLKHIDENTFSVSEHDIDELLYTINPIVCELRRIGDNTVLYYDNNGYPKKYEKLFYGNPFDPCVSNSDDHGTKLLHLDSCIDVMKDIFQSNDANDIELTVYRSE